ncbi:MAG TPA: PAS domain-containing protein [Candidatus Limnocylindria bacterium]|nr:PAS domain-containing protein [Candidatus Limnocylindria bacterium]
MKIAVRPTGEVQRIKALRQYDLLDTRPEHALDDLISLVQRLCEVPVVFVSLVEEHRVRFKSRVGLPDTEFSRDTSFCAHAILQPDLFVVPDATLDERFADSPLVTGEPHIRFYAGMPLFTPTGEALGTLAVVDHVPRHLTPLQQETLKVLSRQVMSQMELRRRTRESLQSEERLRIVTENVRVGLVIVDRDHRYLYANTTYSTLLGLPAGEIVGRRVADVLHGVYQEQIRPRLERAFAGEQVTYELRKPIANSERFYSVRYRPTKAADGTDLVVVVITDITERKQTEAALRTSQADLQLALDAAQLGLWNWDIVTGEITWSPQCFAVYGLPPGEGITYPKFLAAIHPEDRERVAIALQRAVEDRKSYIEEKRTVWPDGSVHWTVSRGQVYYGEDGQPSRMTGVTFDITKRKIAEERTVWLASFPEQNPNPILELDLARQTLHYANPAALQLFPDLPREGLEHPLVFGLLEMELQVAEKGIFRREQMVGEFCFAQTMTYTPETRRVRIYSSDVTERMGQQMALRESEARLNEAQHAAHIGSWRYLPPDRYIWSDEMYELFKLSPRAPLTQEAIFARVHPDDVEGRYRAFRGALESDASDFRGEYRIIWPDGQVRSVLSRGVIRRTVEGQVIESVGTLLDITESKAAEEKVNRLNAELERRVVERTAQLEAANKELEAFSYSVSHDLRSPLRAVDGFAQALVEDFGPQLPERGQRYLRTIREGAQRMGMLIDDLLTFSRLSRLPLKSHIVNTEQLVRSTLSELMAGLGTREIEIKIDELPSCEGDPALLKQVWVNLLSNALKYTAKREKASIEIGALKEPGDTVYFVRDNGTGFDMRYAGKLFGVFQRLHRQEDFGGTGVGLAIVQRIVHRHGGRVWADAVLDRGATFYFTVEGNIHL